jgi:hypothetical protein
MEQGDFEKHSDPRKWKQIWESESCVSLSNTAIASYNWWLGFKIIKSK